uniref:Carrier domain-containing protein n=1 Tax=Bionectria ochroleuca TaxID=29856 RepID=A0A0B7KMI0_BIOOC
MAGQLGNIPQDLSNGENMQQSSQNDVPVSEEDLSRIWEWNATVPERVDDCVHDLISQTFHRQPEAQAVCAWDGNLTYRELDDLSSQLAYRLVGLGVGPGMFVPLCFEKSMWSAVAMLAVMKAGGASVGMDITQPEERLRTIVSQANPHVILASEPRQVLAQRLAKCKVVVVSERHLKQSHPSPVLELPKTSPSSALYLVYTSGSTGTPKGVIVTHSNFSSAIKHQRDALGFTADSRVFDFASYAFDMAWYNFIYTLSVGGCLCVPSEDERKNDVAGCIQRYRISYAFFTPTLARILGRKVLSRLSVLVFAGEPVLPSDTTLCGPEGRTIISYGPAECTPGSTVAQITTTPAGPVVGKGYGVVTWVVDPVRPDRLVPIGEVGELWLEGPLLGDGYLDDPERTTAAFTNDAPWLMEGGTACSGRRGRLYKTGDLVRYQADGSLAFVGRKDTQVKIRGQRVELSEVEHHVHELLKWSDIDGDVDKTTLARVVAELIIPKGSNTPALVIFICLDTGFPDEEARNRTIQKMTAGIDKRLASKIPAYMIPTSYIPIDALPMTATGKTDRRKLREIGSLLTQRQLDSLTRPNHPSRPVSTDMEKNLQALWALVLDIEASSISADDNFLRLGGDSIRAMQLVGIAREHGLSFSVADLFNHPRLESLAGITKTKAMSHGETIPAFSLLKSHQSVEDVQAQAAAMCGVNIADIQDVFPCTPLQEGLMALTGRRKGDYVASITLELDEMTDAQRLWNAWEQVATAAPILRTRIVDIPQQGLVQVILHENVEWEVVDELETYLDDARRKDMGLGTRLSRFGAAFEASSSSPRYLVWTIHHALYDGWSMRLIMNALKDAYQKKAIPYLQPFQAFVKHLPDTEETAAVSFWRNQFTGLEAAQFPALPSAGYHPRPTSKLTSIIESLEWGSTEITGSNLIRAAWSILISNYTGSSDVIFGTTIAGRQSPIAGIERIAAPTISTVPLRIVANPLETVDEIIAKVQKQAVDMIPFEHTGLQCIRQASAGAQEACRFQTLIVVQPYEEDNESNTLFRPSSSSEDSNIEYNALLSYALVVECRLGAKGMRLDANFDENVVESKIVSLLLQQFQYILQQICVQESRDRRLQDVEVTNSQDLETIWNWNDKRAESINSCAHDLFLQVARRQPDAEAICAWDGRLTYAQLDNYSNTLASHLVRIGIGANVRVPLCLEKSKWTPVAMLAVIKAGGIAVAMDITQPEARLCTIVKQSKAGHILSSASVETLANRLGNCLVITVCQENLSSLQNALCTLFTSGSTGTPKGTTLTHSNFSTGIEQQIRAFGIQSSSRVYDFASYAFDFAWSNLLLPLSVGGSICIPSEEQRRNEIVESINELEANFAFFTPSVARVLDSTTLPNLNRLVVGGEAVQRNDFYDWPSRIKLLNIYGPSECTVMATYTDIHPGQENNGTIGKGAGSTTWVVQPSGQNLSPIGAVGELYLEGPLVGIGYLEDAERTASSFLEDPPWLCRGGPGHLGRHGRVYRTGDLVRYNTDGSLVFVGRRDTQVKLRGQRIELQEVEHHVQSLLATDNKNDIQIVAEVIEPEGSGNPTLVAFVHSTMNHSHLEAAGKEAYKNAVRKMTDGIEDRLGDNVPVYMIPTAFIPLQSIPVTVSGKTDRRRLRELGASMYSAHRVQKTKNGYRPPSSELENLLQIIWSKVLNIPLESIAIDTAFTRLGGDSISSMQVVSRCRAKNISITTSDILRSKTIEKLALSTKASKSLPTITSAGILYAVFTSGSTGTPKGVVVTHRNLSSAIKHQKHILGFTPKSRVFDFTSYAFDMAWFNFIHAMYNGSCLCIASDEERMNDPAGCIQRYQITYALFTPTLARIIGKATLSNLEVLALAGEPVLPSDFNLCEDGKTIVVYGPAECTPGSTIAVAVPDNVSAGATIGYGYGVNTWLVDPDCEDKLVSIGEVGELWLEGPLLGQGYLNDSEKTDKAFIQDPSWLGLGTPRHQEQPGRRFYKTGDLARYNPDGSLLFVGRKDMQVKIRGQRVELSEVEHHMRGALQRQDETHSLISSQVQALAEVIRTNNSQNLTLVAFVCVTNDNTNNKEPRDKVLELAVTAIEQYLIDRVPTYMVPAAFIPLDTFPTTATGKTDRLKLRELGASMYDNYKSIQKARHKHVSASTDLQRLLVEVWAEVLNVPCDRISIDVPFLSLGGDSIAAMQVVSRCRARDISVTVGDGVMIAHRNFSSAIKYQQKALRFTPESRVFDFASQAFDLSWYNLLHTLTSGACLCVASDSERRDDVAGSIKRYKITYAQLTPTLARVLGRDGLSGLDTLVLAGEAVLPTDINLCGPDTHVINVYGPAECTPCSTIGDLKKDGPVIGNGLGLRTWIVDPVDGRTLIPIGVVGELWLEGPLVGQGYVNDLDATVAAFVEDPPWLLHGEPSTSGRRGRLYKTGDLVRYDSNGLLIFVGRKDTQVKIRGQRVELSEVEHHVRNALVDVQDTRSSQIIAEVVLPEGSENPTLVVFVSLSGSDGTPITNKDLLDRTVGRMTAGIDSLLSDKVPIYMIPFAYIPIETVPATVTGKTDRRKLRQLGASFTAQQLSNLAVSYIKQQQVETIVEKQLQALWSTVLNIDSARIGLNDSFLRLGGDSIGAMKLVAAARNEGLPLSVADIFQNPTIGALSKILEEQQPMEITPDEAVPAFSLLSPPQDEEAVRTQVAALCRVSDDVVEDAFPCTPLQEGLLALTEKHAGDYTATLVFQLPNDVDIARIIMYIIFTSGSTGRPKAVVLEHQAVVTSCHSYGKVMGLSKDSRVLQFASYAFDACIMEIFSTWLHGGCVCVPSEDNRITDLGRTMESMAVNTTLLTPSVARLLDPTKVPTLKTLILGAEAPRESDYERWRGLPKLFNAYGPAECAVIHSVRTWTNSKLPPKTIGRAAGSCSWIVDQKDHTKLVPIGAVGELLVEGPILARGYLNNAESTAQSFVRDPIWLVRGGPGCKGRSGRLYKTGDLVYYNPDGSLVFVARKDTQVKVRGQRVELGDVEHHVEQALVLEVEHDLDPSTRPQVVAEVIRPRGNSHSILVVFVGQNPSEISVIDEGTWVKTVISMTADIEKRLADRVPYYMVPTAYVPLQSIPITGTGKINRKRLRELGMELTPQQLSSLTSSSTRLRPVETDLQRRLQVIWATVLAVDSSTIGLESNFMRIGGDSISAMQLVGAGRDQGLSFSVADLFRHPRLEEFATIVQTDGAETTGKDAIPAFSLLNYPMTEPLKTEVASLCSINAVDIEDVLPCTPLQQGLMALTEKRAGDYVATIVRRIPDNIDHKRLYTAWKQVVAATPILRTRLIDLPGHGIVQVVMADNAKWFWELASVNSLWLPPKILANTPSCGRFTMLYMMDGQCNSFSTLSREHTRLALTIGR